MSATKLTETQQIVLCAAARWADRCVMLPPRLNGAAAQRVVKKLVDLGLIEEVRARGDLPVWRRDHGGCPMALRITSGGSEEFDRPFLRTTLEKNPRTECRCQPVTVMMAWMVAPSGR